MKAFVRTAYGSPDILKYQEIDTPSPLDNQLLIKVKAIALNPLDWRVLRGDPFLIRLMGFGLFSPKHNILGADFSGIVEKAGNGITQFKVGDEVFGSSIGGFAEYLCAKESQITHKSPNMSFEEAATFPVAGVTALQALRDKGQLKTGQKVLINGASGGVGTFAVQIAKAMGAQVTGVCSGTNVEMVRSIGADNVIDYTKNDYWKINEEFDLIVDNAAYLPIGKPLSILKKGGIYVGVGGSSSFLSILKSFIFNPLLAKIKGKNIVSFIANLNQSEYKELKELFESDKVKPVIDRRYALKEIPDAIRYLETGHVKGKVVILV